jgi:hypothetical protein
VKPEVISHWTVEIYYNWFIVLNKRKLQGANHS